LLPELRERKRLILKANFTGILTKGGYFDKTTKFKEK